MQMNLIKSEENYGGKWIPAKLKVL